MEKLKNNKMKESEIIKKFNLPYYSKGKTMAEAVKQWNNKFKDREDAISLKTKEDGLERFKMAQEYIRESNNIENPGSNQFQDGGLAAEGGLNMYGNIATSALDLYNLGTDTSEIDSLDITKEDPMNTTINKGQMALEGGVKGFTAGMATGNPIIAAGAGLVGVGAGLVGAKKKLDALNKKDQSFVTRGFNQKNNQYALGGDVNGPCGGEGQPPCPELTDQDRDTLRKNKPLGLDYSTGTEGDVLLDRLFYKKRDDQANDPIRLGKYKKVNYFSYDSKDKDSLTLNKGPGQLYNNDAVKMQLKNIRGLNPGKDIQYNEFKMGGKTNNYLGGGIADIIRANRGTINNVKEEAKPTFGNKLRDFFKSDKFKKGANEIGNAALRGTPILNNAIQAFNTQKTDPITLDRLGNRYKPQYADEAALVNRVNNNVGNLTEGIQGASMGSVGALRSNLLGAYLQKGRLLGEEFNRADSINRGQDVKAQEFNLGIDKTNILQANREQDINDANLGAYYSQRSKMFSALSNDIGNVGLERTRNKYAEKMGLMYDSNGKYIGRIDKETGKFISVDQEAEPKQ